MTFIQVFDILDNTSSFILGLCQEVAEADIGVELGKRFEGGYQIAI